MEGIETMYEDPNAVDFIDCAVCTKSIRGDTLYKIHLTTIQHIRKEDTLVATGQATRDHEVPHFTDIKHYLRYLKLDEPIIGLSVLDEVDPISRDGQPGPRYICRMCDLDATLPNMVNHIIGRKHRQKYLEVKRKDLVTWDSTSILAQSGKAIRAKAEIVERQDGQGSPKPLRKKRNVGKLNISRAPPKERGAQNQPKPTLPHPSDMRREGRLHHRGGHAEDDLYRSPFHEDDPYLLAGAAREAYLRGDLSLRGFEEDGLRRASDHEDDLRRREFMEDELRRRDHYLEEQIHGQDYLEDMRRREFLEEGDTRPGHPEEIPHRQAYPEEPPRRSVYLENDPLKQFYSEEVLRRTAHAAEASKERAFREDESPHGRRYPHGPAYLEEVPPERAYLEEVPSERAYPDKAPLCFEHAHGRAAHGPSVHEDAYSEDHRRSGYLEEEEAQRRAYPEEEPRGPAYPEGNPHRRSLDRDPNGRGYPKGPDRQGAADQDLRFTDQMAEPMETGGQSSREHLFDLVKAIRQEGRGPHHPEAERGMGPPGMRGPPQRPAEGGRVRTEIPEPFRRFLEGATDDHKSPGKRKRKSRFSDATEQERDVVKKMQVDDNRRRIEPFAKPQGAYQGGAGSRPMAEATPDTGNVLDELNNIQVENVEEANFLKDKLCNLLKEFQAKKSEKTAVVPAYKSPGPTVISKDYNHMSKDHLESPRDNYERNYREVQEERHYEGHPPRRSQERYTPETLQDPYSGKHRDIDQRMERRAQYEEVFGHVDMYSQSHDRPEEPMAYPHERWQGPMYPRDYPPAEDLYNPFNPAPPTHWERGYRKGGPQSTSLDKITSTLLELVARKK